jgi:kynurenine formamidase
MSSRLKCFGWTLGLVMLSVAQPGVTQLVDLSAGRWVDLSHDYSKETLYWPTAEGFTKETVFEGETEGGFYYTAYSISTAEHGGTHIDAPLHFAEGRQSVDQIPLHRLIGPAVVIDLRAAAEADPDYQASRADIAAWEQVNGEIQPGAIVLFNTGFAKRWPNAESYMGTAERGAEAVAKLHFPGIHPETARFLVRHRSVASVGIDTPSIDYGQSTEFLTHRILYEHDIPGFENLASLDELPASGALLVALPMKIKGGSGAPLRAVAFVPNE